MIIYDHHDHHPKLIIYYISHIIFMIFYAYPVILASRCWTHPHLPKECQGTMLSCDQERFQQAVRSVAVSQVHLEKMPFTSCCKSFSYK
jgi:hypothetical protein